MGCRWLVDGLWMVWPHAGGRAGGRWVGLVDGWSMRAGGGLVDNIWLIDLSKGLAGWLVGSLIG